MWFVERNRDLAAEDGKKARRPPSGVRQMD